MTENELSRLIVEVAVKVHRSLGGPGLPESVYEEALVYELQQRGLDVERQKVDRWCTKANAWQVNYLSIWKGL